MLFLVSAIIQAIILLSSKNIILSSSETVLDSVDDRYIVVIDAGSTGSRAFVVKFSKDTKNIKNVKISKGKKVEPGLSSFEDNLSGVTDYLLPVFIDAKNYIPEANHKNTSVYIKGTAGMRLLPQSSQQSIWEALHNGLLTNPDFAFLIDTDNMGTIDGSQEAFYAAISSNFIEGSIDADMKPVKGTPMVGAFDMGGSSTQLILYNGSSESADKSIKHEDFWSHSWINFGVEKIRERVWEALIENPSIDRVSDSTTGGDSGIVYISNPCTFGGHEHNWNDTHILVGTGDSKGCVRHIKRVMWNLEHSLEDTSANIISPETSDEKSPKYIDGVVHPPLKGRFYGMSVYFYAMDCIRQLGPVELTDW